MITETALAFLKDKKLDELEHELSKIEEAYRFCNQVRASAEEAAQKYLTEKQQLEGKLVQLEAQKAQLIKTRAATEQIVQQTIAQSNLDAQARMKEIEELRAHVRALTPRP